MHDPGPAFRALHQKGTPFVLCNAWDIGSARVLAALGAEALATSSSAYAFTRGLPDGALTRDDALAHAEALVRATPLPVSGDFENGFGEAPETCAETVRMAAEVGLAGISIEDTALPGDDAYDFDLAVERIRAAVDAVSDRLGRRLKFVIGKPGLDGHSNGAEQIAFRARDCGMDIEYQGIRLTPEEIVEKAQAEAAHVVGLSILSGSHMPLVEDVLARMREAGMGDVPVIVGGIIPEADAKAMLGMGVARVYTPKHFELNTIMMDVVALADPTPVAAE